MLLAIDVGNTQTLAGVYHGTELLHDWRISTERAATADELAAHHDQILRLRGGGLDALDAMVVGSVVPPLTAAYRNLGLKYLGREPLVVGPGVRTGISVAIDNPHELGADRLANAVAAHRRYDGACIVVDFGTATNFEVIAEGGRYLGGVLTPGISISSDALFARAARLPRVAIERPQRVIGASTVSAIQSGLYYGYAGLVDGILRRMIEELGTRPRVVATGGLAPLIATASDFIEVVDKTLTLDGLRLVYERSRQ